MLRDSKGRLSFPFTVKDEDKNVTVLVPEKFKSEFLSKVAKKGLTKSEFENWMQTVDQRYPSPDIFDSLGKTGIALSGVAVFVLVMILLNVFVFEGETETKKHERGSCGSMARDVYAKDMGEDWPFEFNYGCLRCYVMNSGKKALTIQGPDGTIYPITGNSTNIVNDNGDRITATWDKARKKTKRNKLGQFYSMKPLENIGFSLCN